MGLVTSRGTTQYASDAHMAGYSRLYKPVGTGRGVLWFHAKDGTEREPWGLDNQGVTSAVLPTTRAFTDAGMVMMSINAGGDNWGNDAAQALASTAKTFLQGTLGAKAGTVIVAGVSMGGLFALNWARANLSSVAAVLLFYPATNLVAHHDATGGSLDLSASINTAYTNLAGYNAAKATHDPAQNAASYTGVPIKMWYSTADTVVGTANQTAFAQAVGGSAFQSQSVGAVGHVDMSAVDPAQVANFLAAYA